MSGQRHLLSFQRTFCEPALPTRSEVRLSTEQKLFFLRVDKDYEPEGWLLHVINDQRMSDIDSSDEEKLEEKVEELFVQITYREDVAKETKTHVMISYCWAQQPIALALKSELEGEGCEVWIDLEEMQKHLGPDSGGCAERHCCHLLHIRWVL